MSGRKNLDLVAALDGDGAAGRIDAALKTVELADRAGDKVGGYSHGMRQRLGIAGALIRDPALLLLDEPTTGLDPAGMRDMRLLVRRLAEQGITVLLSSHIMDEVEDLCDRLAIVRSGRVIYEGRLDELLHSTGQRYRVRTTDDDRAVEVATHQPGVGDVKRDGDGLSLAADEEAAAGLSVALVEAGLGIRALVPASASLEELFFRLTEGDTSPNGAAPRQEVPA
jgi:ABC-2 type transport system ATP-binding protein